MFVDPYSATQADYQRQQLNIIRRHQGLPPIPPGRRYVDFIEGWLSLTWHFILTFSLFIGLALWFHPSEDHGSLSGWQTALILLGPLFFFLYLRGRRQLRLDNEYQATLRRWEEAGRP